MRAKRTLSSRSARRKKRRKTSSIRHREASRLEYWTDEEDEDYSSRRRKKVEKPKRRRQYVPAQIFTFVGMGLPVGYLFLWHLNALPSDTDLETTGLCVASLAGAAWLTIGMSFYEGVWCNTGLMMYSWLIFILILIANVVIIFVELSDSFQDDIAEDEEDTNTNSKWVSLGFATSAILVVSSFIFNVVYIYKCVGQKKVQEDKDNLKAISRRRRRRRSDGYASEGYVQRRRRTRSTQLRGQRIKYSYSEDERRRKRPIRHNQRSRNQPRTYTEIHPRVNESKMSSFNSRNKAVSPNKEQSRKTETVIEITPAQTSRALRSSRGPGSR